jgi:four helix bundle protein
MRYKKLEIWGLAHMLGLAIHDMTLDDLPKFEKYEVGSQIRRSAKSVAANIVEGHSRQCYQKDYYHYLVMAYASLQETNQHLDMLFDTGSLTDKVKYEALGEEIDHLSRKIRRLMIIIKKKL